MCHIDAMMSLVAAAQLTLSYYSASMQLCAASHPRRVVAAAERGQHAQVLVGQALGSQQAHDAPVRFARHANVADHTTGRPCHGVLSASNLISAEVLAFPPAVCSWAVRHSPGEVSQLGAASTHRSSLARPPAFTNSANMSLGCLHVPTAKGRH